MCIRGWVKKSRERRKLRIEFYWRRECVGKGGIWVGSGSCWKSGSTIYCCAISASLRIVCWTREQPAAVYGVRRLRVMGRN